MSWEDFKTFTREEFYHSNEMQKLETELWNHAMVGAGHATYTDRFYKLARLVPHVVTSKVKRIERNGSIKKNPKKRGNGENLAGIGMTEGRSGDQGYDRNEDQDGQVCGQGSEVNDGFGGIPDFSTIIAQQLQNLLLTIASQVGDQGIGQGIGKNPNGDSVIDNIRGDVSMGCTYKEFLACNPKEYDGKGGVIVYTCWIEKMESV
uniref:Reverse transcriptase domain-containing protein n=1 Tax=Tanacetum cinerariifolium TaxID=118510 RepID=A0A699KXF3_TANCI|nr:reverse transcriptase domain-containing protein [Tanacetum cinerariifolium]